MVFRMPYGPPGGGQALRRGGHRIQRFRRGGGENVGREERQIRGVSVRLIVVNELIERFPAGQVPVQRGGVGVQLGAEMGNLIRLLLVSRGALRLRHLGGGAQLLQHVPLFGFVGVHLQTEGADADIVQPLFHHLQRRHFLRHKQHGLAPGQGVGDQRRDGLGLAGAGWAVEHEAAALGGGADGIELGGVGAQWQEHTILVHRLANLHGLRRPGQFPVHEAADDLVFRQVLRTAAEVVPHDELREGKRAETGGFQHIPVPLLHDGATHRREYRPGVHPVLVPGQRIQTGDGQTVVHLQLFQQRDVHLRLVVPQTDDVALGGGLSSHINRDQHQRRIARHGAFLRLIPAQQAQRKIHRVRAALLQRHLRRAVQLLDAFPKLALGEQGAEAVVLEFGGKKLGGVHAGGHGGEQVGRVGLPVRGPGQDGEIRAVGQGILQIIHRGGQQRHKGFCRAEVDEGVSKAQIQQLALPAVLASRRGFRSGIRQRRALFRRGGQLLLRTVLPLHRPAVLGFDPQRQRPHTAESGAAHVDDALQILLSQGLARQLPRAVEGYALARDEGGTFHHGQLVHTVGQALADQRSVILHRVGEGQILQPDAGKDVLLFQN